MNKTLVEQFFSLLRAGLWEEKPDSNLFNNKVDWRAILGIAKNQTVTGVVFDGLQNLDNCRCDRDILLEWISITNRIEAENRNLNQALAFFVYKFREHGLNPIALKGQCVAQYYKNPLHRHPGDIDLYFKEGYDEANKLIADMPNVVEEEETTYHKGFYVSGVSIENHLRYVDFYSIDNKRRWEEILPLLHNDKYDKMRIISKHGKEVDICYFNPQLNAIYLFLHIQHHLLQTGIGLRQVCDWACLWKSKEQEIDKELFLKVVDILPIKRCMTALTWIVENYLGLPKGTIPLDTTGKQACKDGEFLLNDIMRGGNFGRGFGFMDGFVRNKHWHNLRTYVSALKRMIKIRGLCPSEVDAYIAYWIKERL